MAEETARRVDPNGRRWYDSAKIVWGLFVIVATLLTFFGKTLWTVSEKNEAVNVRQDIQIERLVYTAENTDKRMEKMDSKLDRIMERLPK